MDNTYSVACVDSSYILFQWLMALPVLTAMSSNSSRHSGLQRQVLALYRSALREASRKDLIGATRGGLQPLGQGGAFLDLLAAEPEGSTTSYARAEFRRRAASVSRSDFRTIEHMIRAGEKQLKILMMPGVSSARGR